MADPDLDDALSHLDDGLELVLDRDGARWQHPGRSHLFFEVDAGRAEALFSELSDRFQTRSQNGRRVLTPEPVEHPAPETGGPNEIVLSRTWLRYQELADAIAHLSYRGAESFVTRHEDLTVRHVTGHGDKGLHPVVRADDDLVAALEADYPELPVTLDITQPVRELAPIQVELSEPWHTYYQLADLLQRDVETVRRGLLNHREVLVLDRKMIDSRHRRIVYTTPMLADVIERVWQAEVTIAAGLRQGVAA